MICMCVPQAGTLLIYYMRGGICAPQYTSRNAETHGHMVILRYRGRQIYGRKGRVCREQDQLGPGDMQPASDDIVISQAWTAMLSYEMNSCYASQHSSARNMRTEPGGQSGST